MGNSSTKWKQYLKLSSSDDVTDDLKNKESNVKKISSAFSTSVRTMKLVWPHFWPQGETMLKVRVVIAIMFLILSKVVNLFVPILYQRVIDSLPSKTPVHLILLYGVFRWLSSNIKDFRDAVFVNVENHATQSIALNSFTHLHNLSLGYHLTRNTGALLRIMDKGKAAITLLMQSLGFVLLPALLEVFMTCGLLFVSYGGWYSLITFTSVMCYIVFTFIFTEWRRKFRRVMNETDNEASNTALDSLLNYETVKYFTAEAHEIKRYNKNLLDYFNANTKNQLSLSVGGTVRVGIMTTGLVISLWLSANEVESGKLSLGDLVAINVFIVQVFNPLTSLGGYYRLIVNSFTDMEQLFGLLDEKPSVTDEPDASELEVNGPCEVEFKDVSFTYPRRGESSELSPVIRGISFKIAAGKTVAVVGHSGSGKTTISRLLCRFYDPETGSVTVNGRDIRTVSQTSLRKHIGVVPQDTVLFNDTFYYNIAFGNISKEPNEVKKTVEEAAKEANIHNFIMSLPDTYQTKVGERGLRLSGGEKQRVAIARTILKDPSILILDEATSALDSITEREIQSSLMEVSRGRTTLIIAHRLSTVVSADLILVVKAGLVIEQGTHQELLQMNGEYKSMWEIQSKEIDKNS